MTGSHQDLRRVVAAMHWTLYKRRSTGGRLLVNILFGLLGALAAAGLVAGAIAAGLQRSSSAGAVIATALIGIGLMWAYLPALSGFSDNALHPRQFTLLPVRPAPLARALFTASLIGMPVPLTLLACTSIVGYSAFRSPVTLLLAVPAVPLTALLMVALSRVISLGLSQAAQSRRAREAVLLLFVTGFCALYAGQFMLNRLVSAAERGALGPALAVPFAWGVGAVERAAQGDWLLAVGAVAALAALDAALIGAWQLLIRRQFSGKGAVPSGSQRRRERRGYLRRGWRARPTGAVVARELSLWRGDIRRRYQLLSPIAFAVMSGLLPLLLEGFPFNARWGAWIALLMAVMAALNLYGLDGKSFWHLAMVPGAAAADVRGRQLAWVIVTIPIAVLPVLLVRAFGDSPLERLAVPVTVTVCMLGVGSGLMAYASAAAPYPVPEARKMMSFSTRNSSSGAAIGMAFGSMGLLLVTAGPCALLAALLPGPASWLAVPVALAVGAGGWWWLGRAAVGRLQRYPDRIQYDVTRT
ncbi:hypothetical protein GCM10027289_22290 [Tsukamurella serpentis]